MTRCDQTPQWKALQAHYDTHGKSLDVRQALTQQVSRFEAYSQSAPYVFADLSKNLIDDTTHQLLLDLARACGVEAHRDAMFAGEAINNTEDRAVMHWLLRTPAAQPVTSALQTEYAEVHLTLDRMLAFAQSVRDDAEITDVVNIGIGGSDLGPHMAVLALDDWVTPQKRFHFVSNVDGHELAAVLRRVQAKHTLFLIASKTFTTAETMTNAQSAKAWFQAQGGTDTARHFAALTTNVAAAQSFGISTTFGFWDWVGGRYSMWSAIGLPIAIAIGVQGFRDLLAGAHAMDEHFRTAPLAQNLPMRLGLLDLWYRNFHRFTSRCIAPYHCALQRLPAYLQQLEMESNGKQVSAQGQPLGYATSPVVWGEPGTNGQHAYFQMLHQGTDIIPTEFIAVKTPSHSLPGHHPMLLANALAQAQALMLGKKDDATGGMGPQFFPGNRPSSFFVLDSLCPQSLGAFIALYEHRVFVSGSLWGINSFDQWGVELGKILAKHIQPCLQSPDHADTARHFDASTAGLIRYLSH